MTSTPKLNAHARRLLSQRANQIGTGSWRHSGAGAQFRWPLLRIGCAAACSLMMSVVFILVSALPSSAIPSQSGDPNVSPFSVVLTPTDSSVSASWTFRSPESTPLPAATVYTLERSEQPNGANPTTVSSFSERTWTDDLSRRTDPMQQLAAGAASLCGLVGGAVYCWGANQFGQLGNGTGAASSRPVAVRRTGPLSNTLVRSIGVGKWHACALTEDRALACWGNNEHGQLGIGAGPNRFEPVAVNLSWLPANTRIESVVGGEFFSCVLLSSNEIYCWGFNEKGQLGSGSTQRDVYLPTKVLKAGVLDGQEITAIQANSDEACAVTKRNLLYCWGDNDNGQLGIDRPIAMSRVPVQVALGDVRVATVTIGSNHVCAISLTQDVFCWGSGRLGQLGNESTSSSSVPRRISMAPNLVGAVTAPPSSVLTSISSNGDTTCVLRKNSGNSDAVPVCWGSNESSQLGMSVVKGKYQSKPTDNGALPNNAWSERSFSGVTVPDGSVCILSAQGYPYCRGKNDSGQLGDLSTGSPQPNFTPVNMQGVCDPASIPMDGVCSLRERTTYYYRVKAILQTQRGYYSERPGDRVLYSTWKPVTTLSRGNQNFSAQSGPNEIALAWNATARSNGFDRTSLISRATAPDGTNATVLYSGPNLATKYVPVQAKKYRWLNISAGVNVACGVISGRAFCWGNNAAHGLGTGESVAKTTTPLAVNVPLDSASNEVVKKVAVGGDGIACALTSAFRLYCWGDSAAAYGTNASIGSATPVPAFTSVGKVTDVVAGADFACVLSALGKVLCAGENDFGQLGSGDTVQHRMPVAVRGSEIELLTITQMSAGLFQVCVLDSTDWPFCWGKNDRGQLGTGTTSNSSQAVHPATRHPVLQSISAGDRSSCGTDHRFRLWCWGDNSFGQLGNGTTTSSLVPTLVKSTQSFRAVSVARDGSWACAEEFDSYIYCWGSNSSAQFGIGKITRSEPTPVRTYYVRLASFSAGASFSCGVYVGSETWLSADNGTATCAGALANPVSGAGIGTAKEWSSLNRAVVGQVDRSFFRLSYQVGAYAYVSPWIEASITTPIAIQHVIMNTPD